MSYGHVLSGELFCAEGGDERGMVLHGENEGGGNICIPIRERRVGMAFGMRKATLPCKSECH